MNYSLEFDKRVIKDFKKIDKSWQKKIVKKIKEDLIKNPYIGKKLSANLSDYYKLRVNDYKIVYKIKEEKLLIIVFKIKHRKNIYD
ncbi:MAG: RelE/StbE replicon stabilization toxin [uncultured Campylobacterales bacterium]|uniref:RelE/StbE replicon stabilization toxin n=1 Tax=uncultured Campylobacterales bacterium TaxID=352960 RepID=A0A6S6SXX2_9BACT|nr:MAG: RelE/StbE replicon stabilization toxin [uncultured Campylobacterales bacterium]